MTNSDKKFWPFKPHISIFTSIFILIGLLFIFVILKRTNTWPKINESETTLLIGILLFSLLPVLLALIDIIIDRGGAFEIAGVKIDFAQVPQKGVSDVTVPANIGVPGQSLNDSSTTQILDSLRQATACEVVIIDLEDGTAWWETRLLVLLAGATRLKRPGKIVFVGRDGGIDKYFQGWGHPSKLLSCLLSTRKQYSLSYHKVMAAARQWEMVEPTGDPALQPQNPWGANGLAMQHPWMAFDSTTGLPNTLFAEQLLASELGKIVENQEEPKTISIVQMENLFRPVLHKNYIDEKWSAERQIKAFFDMDSDYFAVTQNGRYKTLVSRLNVLNAMVKTLVEKKQKA